MGVGDYISLNRRIIFSGLLLSIFVLGLSSFSYQEASAVVKTWDGGAATTSWNDADNWSDNALPANGDTITIGGSVTVNFDVTSFLLSSGSLTIDAGSTLIIDSGSSLNLGGTAVVTNNGTITNNGLINMASLIPPNDTAVLVNNNIITNNGAFAISGTTTNSATGTITSNTNMFHTGGTFTNDGDIFIAAGGNLLIGGTGTGCCNLENNGDITNQGRLETRSNPAATINNNNGGVIENQSFFRNGLGNTVNNDAGAKIENQGTYENPGTVGMSGTDEDDAATATNNNGDFNNYCNGTFYTGVLATFGPNGVNDLCPTLVSAALTSNNVNDGNNWAKNNDVATLALTFSDSIPQPTVLIGGLAATESPAGPTTGYSATRTILSSEIADATLLTYRVDFTDAKGNTAPTSPATATSTVRTSFSIETVSSAIMTGGTPPLSTAGQAIITYSDDVTATSPAADYTVLKVGTQTCTIGTISAALGSIHTIDFNCTTAFGTDATGSLKINGGATIEDPAGNAVVAVTQTLADGQKPVVTSAKFTTGTNLEIKYSEAATGANTDYTVLDFTIDVDTPTIGALTGSGTATHNLAFSDVGIGTDETGSIKINGGATIKDAANNELDGVNQAIADGQAPVVTSLARSDALINDALVASPGTSAITIVYSEAMDQTGGQEASVTFNPTVSTTLTETGGSPTKNWSSATTLVITYTLADVNVDVNSVDISNVDGARDNAPLMNSQTAYTAGLTGVGLFDDTFEIDTDNPEIAAGTFTITSNNAGFPLGTTDFAKDGDKVFAVITATEALRTSLPADLIKVNNILHADVDVTAIAVGSVLTITYDVGTPDRNGVVDLLIDAFDLAGNQLAPETENVPETATNAHLTTTATIIVDTVSPVGLAVGDGGVVGLEVNSGDPSTTDRDVDFVIDCDDRNAGTHPSANQVSGCFRYIVDTNDDGSLGDETPVVFTPTGNTASEMETDGVKLSALRALKTVEGDIFDRALNPAAVSDQINLDAKFNSILTSTTLTPIATVAQGEWEFEFFTESGSIANARPDDQILLNFDFEVINFDPTDDSFPDAYSLLDPNNLPNAFPTFPDGTHIVSLTNVDENTNTFTFGTHYPRNSRNINEPGVGTDLHRYTPFATLVDLNDAVVNEHDGDNGPVTITSNDAFVKEHPSQIFAIIPFPESCFMVAVPVPNPCALLAKISCVIVVSVIS